MMEDFSGLALPPLFGGHILEAELEPGGVELGPSGTELLGDDGAPSGPAQDQDDETREMDKKKCQALSRRCKEIEQVNEKIVGRLHQVQRLTRRLRKERRASIDETLMQCYISTNLMKKTLIYKSLVELRLRTFKFLMKTLDSYGDDYRTAQLTFTLEDEGKAGLDPAAGAEEDSSSPTLPRQSAAGSKKKRHRLPKDRERVAQMEAEHPLVTEGQFTGFSPSSPPH